MAKRPTAQTISEDEWESHRVTIIRMYLDGKPLAGQDGVIRTMLRDYQFNASKWQYESRFRKWNVKKNRKGDEWQAISAKILKRKRAGKESEVYDGQTLLPPKKVRKEIQRHCSLAYFQSENDHETLSSSSLASSEPEDAPSPALPEGISVCTPGPMDQLSTTGHIENSLIVATCQENSSKETSTQRGFTCCQGGSSGLASAPLYGKKLISQPQGQNITQVICRGENSMAPNVRKLTLSKAVRPRSFPLSSYEIRFPSSIKSNSSHRFSLDALAEIFTGPAESISSSSKALSLPKQKPKTDFTNEESQALSTLFGNCGPSKLNVKGQQSQFFNALVPTRGSNDSFEKLILFSAMNNFSGVDNINSLAILRRIDTCRMWTLLKDLYATSDVLFEAAMGPLFWIALESGHSELAQRLIDQGLKIESLVIELGEETTTPLDRAVSLGNVELTTLLVNAMATKLPKTEFQLRLQKVTFWLFQNDHFDNDASVETIQIVQLLIKSGAKVQEEWLSSPHSFVFRGINKSWDINVLELLVKSNDFDLWKIMKTHSSGQSFRSTDPYNPGLSYILYYANCDALERLLDLILPVIHSHSGDIDFTNNTILSWLLALLDKAIEHSLDHHISKLFNLGLLPRPSSLDAAILCNKPSILRLVLEKCSWYWSVDWFVSSYGESCLVKAITTLNLSIISLFGEIYKGPITDKSIFAIIESDNSLILRFFIEKLDVDKLFGPQILKAALTIGTKLMVRSVLEEYNLSTFSPCQTGEGIYPATYRNLIPVVDHFLKGEIPVAPLSDASLKLVVTNGSGDLIKILLNARFPEGDDFVIREFCSADSRYYHGEDGEDDEDDEDDKDDKDDKFVNIYAEAVYAKNSDAISYLESHGFLLGFAKFGCHKCALSVLDAIVTTGNIEGLRQFLSLRIPHATSIYPLADELSHAMDASLRVGRMDITVELLRNGAQFGHEAIVKSIETDNQGLFQKILSTNISLLSYFDTAAQHERCSMIMDMVAQNGGNGCEALQAAINYGNKRIIKKLVDSLGLSSGFQLKHRGYSILGHAVDCSTTDMVQYLISLGFSPNDPDAVSAALGTETASLILDAIKDQHGSLRTAEGTRTLFMALGREEQDPSVIMKLIDIVNMNLSIECYGDNTRVNTWKTALGRGIETVVGDNLNIIKYMLSCGANANSIVIRKGTLTASWKDTSEVALMTATRVNNLAAMALLIHNGADVNHPVKGFVRYSPLQYASLLGRFDATQRLLEAGASPNEKPAFKNGGTALQLASMQGWVGIVELLLLAGADVNAPPSEVFGNYALVGAAASGRIHVVQLLIKMGADPEQFQTAMDVAESKGHFAVWRYIRDAQELHIWDCLVFNEYLWATETSFSDERLNGQTVNSETTEVEPVYDYNLETHDINSQQGSTDRYQGTHPVSIFDSSSSANPYDYEPGFVQEVAIAGFSEDL